MRISDWSSDVCSSDLSTGPLCRLDPAAACARGDRQRHDRHRATHAMKLAIALQYLLPHRLLSRLAYGLARWRWQPFKRAMIDAVIRRFNVNLSEPEKADPDTTQHGRPHV